MLESSQRRRIPGSAEVEAHLRAGAPWARTRDIPDVAGWEDLVTAPEAVHKCLWRRIADGRCPMPLSVVSLPKPGTNELRKITWMDLFDELWYRIQMGQIVDEIEASLQGPAEVFSYRILNTTPAWSVRPNKEAWTLWRNRSFELLEMINCRAIGSFDIRNYYPTIFPDKVASVLAEITTSEEVIYLLEQFLRQLTKLGGPPGIPIGAESSGLIGNIMLTKVDKALSPHVISHLRFTDDSRVFLSDVSRWDEICNIYNEAANRIGFTVNHSKLSLHMKGTGEAYKAIQNDRIEYLIASQPNKYIDPEMSADEIEIQIKSDGPDWRVVNFCLGGLISKRSAEGLRVLYENPSILVETPVQASKYLMELASDSACRKKIDRDWLIDFATATPNGRTIAGQIHACRVAERLGVSKDHGKRLEEVALSSANRNIPLKAWAAMAWGASSAYRPGTAVDHAACVGDFSLRRAFVLTIDPSEPSGKNRWKWYQRLSTLEPDLEPSLTRIR